MPLDGDGADEPSAPHKSRCSGTTSIFLVQMVFPHGLQRIVLCSVTVMIGNPAWPYFSCSMAVPIPSRQFSGFILDSKRRSATILFYMTQLHTLCCRTMPVPD